LYFINKLNKNVIIFLFAWVLIKKLSY